MRIWFVALIPAFFYGIYKSFKKHKDIIFLLIWSLSVFVFFSVAKSKLVWYITPIYPALAILVGLFVRDVVHLVLGFAKKVFKKQEVSLAWPFLIYFGITIFGLTYFYYHKKMVYTGDLTGKQARLIKYKDVRFGLEEVLYVDKVEPPLALFYSDGPSKTVDYAELHKTIKTAKANEQVVFMTKTSRFDSLEEEFPNLLVVMQEKEWVLGYLPVKPVEEEVLGVDIGIFN
ncbi:MAG TPA: hypothetical protein ENN92_01145 [candidate division WWE3 bacterium]|uniref:Uncharacterized protein n=1 Tax=candidate division WWE3 bacterium TaxID=2053526 RepID=A0A7C1HIZ5_UNCKA|nr:hypothetical protein [candidate division WWE3 bacterium]